ncbi:DUF1769-domain-containing protein [Saccharata proteae CBS 121410]|uniref:DUF1769-domain-containing protein n=1 Tax=Saccharata proteae CBS 121410 TaxID=1314787 RepID=A0A6A5YCJ5_9PEZI|nr:DUF1769-domain-containing protein [Saccharata proteae CBS 121410]
MAEHTKYILKVTAGPTYDVKDHQDVHVNAPTPAHITSKDIDASINVRIQNYRGLPEGSPETSPYFAHAPHTSDLYSISFAFKLKNDVPGNSLVFGNDFDHPIRDRLPPGFNYAFKFVTSWIDPTMSGDVYADEPYLYSPVLSSMNVLRVGRKDQSPADHAKNAGKTVGQGDSATVAFEEGADGDGAQVRKENSMPDAAAARMKHFRQEGLRKNFTFEEGRTYGCDFFNPYLDFNEFSLKLTGFTLPIIKYWDGQPLRYVMKNLDTNEPLFVIMFTLLPADETAASQIEDKPHMATAGQDDWEKVAKAESDGTTKQSSNDNEGKAQFVDDDID